MQDGETRDGIKEGEWIRYYANGQVSAEGRYENGKKEGCWVLYHSNGNPSSEATFVGGKYSGLYTAYHPNGKRRLQGRYNEAKGVPADGTKQGVWCDYEEDGETIRRKITYHRGSRACPDKLPPLDADTEETSCSS